MRTLVRIVFAALIACSAPAAFAQSWTAVCSTGSVDEASLARFAFSGPAFHYLPTSTSVAPITERFNVTNTFDNNTPPDWPGWMNLELGYAITSPTDLVSATLVRVDSCTGLQTTVCTVNNLPGTTCNRCTIPANLQPVDFGKYLYYVLVTVSRTATTSQPKCQTLRIF